jgi:two-component system probable response regulator PhcQ
MHEFYDYRKYAILYVDDEAQSLKSFTRAFEDQFRILTATNAQDGLKLLEQHGEEIGLLMTDQRMPGEKGVWLLERARQQRPHMIRLLATAYSDMDAAIAAVNTGAIYKYVTKPWDPAALEHTLKRGLEFFLVQAERDQLLREKMSVLHNMMISDRIVSLGLLAAGLSHHIRNSLVAVKTFMDLAPMKLQEEKISPDELRNPDFWNEYYGNVQNQIEKINNMLKDLWTASEKPTIQFNDSVQLRSVLDEAVAKLQAEFTAKKISIVNSIPADLPPLRVDKPKFDRLFELLLRDELVSLPVNTRVALTAKVVGDQVHFQLHDNGPGLPQEALRLVFDPFVLRTDTPMEYGINLMACYFIVHHHGGKIDASSAPGAGTTFTLRLLQDSNRAVQPKVGEADLFQKVVRNESLWEKLITHE